MTVIPLNFLQNVFIVCMIEAWNKSCNKRSSSDFFSFIFSARACVNLTALRFGRSENVRVRNGLKLNVVFLSTHLSKYEALHKRWSADSDETEVSGTDAACE